MGDEGEKMNINGFDELPIEIIQHIQSFLGREDAANTGLLSKYWYDAWSTRPILDFSDVLPSFYEDSIDYERDDWTIWLSVRRTMERYKQSNLKLEKLVLTNDYGYGYKWYWDDYTSYVDELLKDASTLGVKELHSTLEDSNHYEREPGIDFPTGPVFAIRSLTKLSVISASKAGTMRGPIVVQCPCLVSLSLDSVHIRDNAIQDILLGCPLIENLDINCCDVTDIDVSNLHNLVVLHIRKTPNECTKHVKVSFASLANGGINSFPRLRTVWLIGVEINEDFFQNFASRFPGVEDLILNNCTGYEDIHISSKSLKSMTLHLKGKKVEKAEFDVPDIRKFKFKSPDIPAMSFRTLSVEWESDVKLSCSDENIGVSWFVRLREFLEELSLSKIYLHLKVDKSQPIWVKNISQSPPVVVEHLMINYHPQGQALLCALFGCCHPEVIELYNFKRYTEAYSFAEALHGLFKHQNANSLSEIHELVEIGVEIFQDLEWQNIPLEHFVEDFPKFQFENSICILLKWGDFECT